MKIYLLFTSICFFLISCGNNKKEQTVAEESDLIKRSVKTVWEATLNDSSGRLQLKKTIEGKLDTLSPAVVITYLNNTYGNVILELVKTSNDTLFTKISDATYLTQQMGSTGPTIYLAAAVYNLTEIPGIRFVSFYFEEGDHAQPGTFTRENFKDE
jgi:hypothetical protein